MRCVLVVLVASLGATPAFSAEPSFETLRPIAARLLSDAVHADALRRERAGQLLHDMADRNARDRRLTYRDGRAHIEPFFDPSHVDAAARVLKDQRASWPARLAVIDSLADFGTELPRLWPAVRADMEIREASYHVSKEIERLQGIWSSQHRPFPEMDMVRALAFAPDELLPVLAKSLVGPDERIAKAMEMTFEWLRDRGLPHMLPFFGHEDATVRARAIRAVASVETVTPELEAALRRAHKDSDQSVRKAAKYAWKMLPAHFEYAAWTSAIRDGDAGQRLQALNPLVIGRPTPGVFPAPMRDAILALAPRASPPEWRAIVRLIVPSLKTYAVSITKGVFRHGAGGTPETVALALGEGAIPDLVDLLVGDDRRTDWVATMGLLAFETLPDAQRERLAAHLGAHPKWPHNTMVATVLARPGETRAIPFLLRGIDATFREERSWAALGLARLGDPAHLDLLIECATSIRGKPLGPTLRAQHALRMLLMSDPPRAIALLGVEGAVGTCARESLDPMKAKLRTQLEAAWDDANEGARMRLLRLGPTQAVLSKAMDDHSPRVCFAAARIATGLPALRAAAAFVLLDFLVAGDHGQARLAAMYLAKYGDALLPSLRPLATLDDEQIRARVRFLIGLIERAR